MQTRSATIPRPIDDRKPSRGGAVDGRSPVGRRRRELIDIYTAALGGPAALTDGQQIDIRKAAELTALAEQARAAAMQKGFADTGALSAMVRLESEARRAVKALGIKPGKVTEPVADLAAYLANKASGGVA